MSGESTGLVLIVDDVDQNRELLMDLVEAQGHTVLEAADGASALALLARHPVDCVLLDVMMPRMDGYEVCRRIRADANTAALPVLLITALNDRKDRLQGIGAGATDFICKPFDAQEVMLRVRNSVAQNRLFRDLERLNVEKNRWLGTAAHDLRNPLGVVSSYCRLLMAGLDAMSPQAQRALSAIERSASFMQGLVDDLLDVARIEAGFLDLDLEESDVALLVQNVVSQNQLLSEQKRIRLHLHGARSLSARIDTNKIEQVLNNLISNAVKFSHEGSQVDIDLEACDQGLLLKVRDRGAGIPRARLDVLFEPFGATSRGTAQERGSGLGLAIVKRIVEGHGGRIWVESVEDHGSTFFVWLPVDTASSRQRALSSTAATA